MPTTKKEEWYIIVNPHAGSGKTMRFWVPAENRLAQLGVKFNTVFTTHKHHATELAAVAARMGYRKIMAVGGDGSIHDVFDGVLGWCLTSGVDPSEFYFSVVPIGSGNDWIKSFNLPKKAKDMVDVIAKETYVTEDVVKVTTGDGKISFMANIGGLGFDSKVCQRVNSQKERGMRSRMIYVYGLVHALCHAQALDLCFERDGEKVFSGEVYDIGFGNGKYCGGGMQQCPLANPDDQILDAMIVPKMKIKGLLPVVPRVFNGTLDKSEKVIYVRGKNFKIIPNNPATAAEILELDGEEIGTLPCEIEITGQKVNVLANI